MSKKKFTVEFECDETTRFVENDEVIAQRLAIVAASVAKVNTSGAVPKVNVTVSEQ